MSQPFWEKAYKDLATPAIRGGVPSPEIREIAAQLPPAARVLDLECGEGRNDWPHTETQRVHPGSRK